MFCSLGLKTLYTIDRDAFVSQKGKLNIDKTVLENYSINLDDRGLLNDEEILIILRRMLSLEIESRISIDKLYEWMVQLILMIC